MSIYDTSFDDLTEHDLLELRTAGVHEGRSIDYKVQLPGNAESDKRELRCDVTSFANADGGHIVFGVVENHGAPVSLPGLGGINPDREIQRLDSIVQTSIDPRIPGVRFRAIPLECGTTAIIGLVPRSSVGPHLVQVEESKRFYSRNSAGKYSLSGAEIRAAYTSAAVLASLRMELQVSLASLCVKRQVKLRPEDLEPALRTYVEALPEPDREAALRTMVAAMQGTEMDIPLPRHRYLRLLVEALTLRTNPSDTVSLDRTQQFQLIKYLLAEILDPRGIRTAALRQVTTMGSLLAYDPATQALQNSELSGAISDLIAEVEAYASQYETVQPRLVPLLAKVSKVSRARFRFDLTMADAVPLWSVYCSQVRVYSRVAALYRYLLGKRSQSQPDPDRMISANPFGPEEKAKVARETATPEDVRRWSSLRTTPRSSEGERNHDLAAAPTARTG